MKGEVTGKEFAGKGGRAFSDCKVYDSGEEKHGWGRGRGNTIY